MGELSIRYSPHPGQWLFHRSSARFRVLCCGTRWGKDRASINELIKICAELASQNRDKSLIPRVHAWIVAPVYALAKQSWTELKEFVPDELVLSINETERTMRWKNGVVIEVKSADRPQQLVSVGLDVLLITEASRVKDEAWHQSLRGRLASPGRAGKAIINSTPWGGLNWFHKAFIMGQKYLVSEGVKRKNPDYDAEWESWQFPTSTNPYIDPKEIDSARSALPERFFRMEFMAEFLDDAGGVFRGVQSCVDTELESPEPPQRGRRYVMGVDWARRQDYTSCVVVDITDVTKSRVVAIDRYNRIGYELQLARVKKMADTYNCFRIVVEENGIGDPLVEQLQKDLPGKILPFMTTNMTKRHIVDALAVKIERGEISLPAKDNSASQGAVDNAEELINELKVYAYTMSESGALKYSAPSGSHDDLVMALSFANHAADSSILPAIKMGNQNRVNWTGHLNAGGVNTVKNKYNRVNWKSAFNGLP